MCFNWGMCHIFCFRKCILFSSHVSAFSIHGPSQHPGFGHITLYSYTHLKPCMTLQQCIVKTLHYVCCETSPKVYRQLHWWPLLMSSRPGSRWRLEQARRHTAESSTASGRSSRRKVSGHFGRAQEVNAHTHTLNSAISGFMTWKWSSLWWL